MAQKHFDHGIYWLGSLSRASGWSYSSAEDWGGLCSSGRKQSPIDLNTLDSTKGVYHRLKLKNYARVQHNLKMVNNGHTVKVTGFKPKLTLRGGPTASEYVLEEFHLHWDSEHTIDGTRFPLELHFVHRNIQYPDVKSAFNHEDGIAVIGALYHLSYSDNYELWRIIEGLGAVKEHSKINQPVRLAGPIVVYNLLPSMSKYYAYAGSLTTPTCHEAVTWIVLKQTFPVSQRQLERFKEIDSSEGTKLRSNYRALQARGNREVYLVSEAPGQARLSVSISLILVFVLVDQLVTFEIRRFLYNMTPRGVYITGM